MDTIIFILLITLFLISFVIFYNSYNEYKKTLSRGNKTGYDASLEVTKKYELDCYIIEKKGEFTDNYNYNKKVIKLSSIVFHDNNNYSVAMGYFIAMQAILDKENNILFKMKKLFEPLYYFLITVSYICIFLLAFTNFNILYLIVMLVLCFTYQLVFLRTNLDIIRRIKNNFVTNDIDLVHALDSLCFIDIAFGVLYIRVLIDKMVDFIKKAK